MWKKKVEARKITDDSVIRRVLFAYWITTATDTLTVCNIAFPLQEWFHDTPHCYVYTYVVCLRFHNLISETVITLLEML